jgi:hypothetical protein
MTTRPDRIGRHAILDRLDGPAGRELYAAENAVGEAGVVVWLRRGLDTLTAEAWLQAAGRAALVHHPALIDVVDSGRHGDSAFVALERWTGRTLGETMARRAAWPLRSRARCAGQLCKALTAVHRAGLVHGDIDPAAVYVEAAERVKLTPPGLSIDDRVVGETADDLRYRCPEELEGHPLDRQSDVYLLGAVLYLLLAGRDPFTGPSPDAVRFEILRDPPAPLAGRNATVSPLDEVLRRAMAKTPEARYADAEAMAADLLPALEPLQAPAEQPVAAPQVRGPSARPMPPGPTPVVVGHPSAAEPLPVEPAATSPSLALDENVQFTVYRPKVLVPGRWQTMLAFAHLAERRDDAPPDEPDPVQEVAAQAAALLADVGEYRQHTEDSLQAVPREGELTFVPAAEGVDFNPQSRTFTWAESVHREEFRMRASAAAAGRIVHGRVTVFLGSIVLAEIGMSLRVGGAAVTSPGSPAVDSARPYRRIFASYSHKDAAIVDEFSAYARALGDRYLRDVIDLRSGERWQPALEGLIRQADVFQLFWSWNALESAFVRQEWQYALSLRRPRFVRPVYWDEPMPERGDEPPQVLRQLHFERVRFARASAAAGTPLTDAAVAQPGAGLPPPAPMASPRSGAAPSPPPSAPGPDHPTGSRPVVRPLPAPPPESSGPLRRASWMRTALPALAAVILAAVFVPYLFLSTSDSPDGSVDLPSVGAPAEAPPPPPPTVDSSRPAPTLGSPTPPSAAESLDIGGRWTDAEGSVFELTQDESIVRLTGTSVQGVAIQGTGTLAGRQLTMPITMEGLGTGQLALELSADGRRLEGTIAGPEGSAPVVLER